MIELNANVLSRSFKVPLLNSLIPEQHHGASIVPCRHLPETKTNVLSVPEPSSQPARKSATLYFKRRKITTKFTKCRASKLSKRRKRTAVFSSSDSLRSSSNKDASEKSPVEKKTQSSLKYVLWRAAQKSQRTRNLSLRTT